jgi:tetratricopeptide (TPR) repeat protein
MSQTHTQENEVVQPLQAIESFWKKNQKRILTAVLCLVILGGGLVAYKNFVVKPKEEEAAGALFKAEEYYRMDSLNLALNGNKTEKGFLYVINNYGSTASGNLARYYAGSCYLRTGDFNNAIKYLEEFNTDAPQIQMMAYGMLGDAYGELKKDNEAIEYYKKAGKIFPKDESFSAEYLFRAAQKSALQNKTEEAVSLYREIKEKYPQTERGYQVDKFIYELSIEPNDFIGK